MIEPKVDQKPPQSTKIQIQQASKEQAIAEKSDDGSDIKEVDIEDETHNQEELSHVEDY